MSPVHMDELPAEVQAKILEQITVDDNLSPTPLLASEMNEVADAVIQGVNDFAKVLPQIITLREYFETAERDSAHRLRVPIKSCRTWTEFCRTHLGENIRTIQRLLKDVNKKPKLESEPAEVSPETEESDAIQPSANSVDVELTSLFPSAITAEVVEKELGEFLVSLAFHGNEDAIRKLAAFIKTLLPAAEQKSQEYECEDTVI